MITKNYKNLLKTLLSAVQTGYVGGLPVVSTGNITRYILARSSQSVFPYVIIQTFTLYDTSAGISVGTGSTAATENDYILENTITSGLSGSITTVQDLDVSNNPQLTFIVTLTNTSASSITVSEIGYKQSVWTSTAQGSSSGGTSTVCLFDRTVLTTPLTIPAGESGAIKYVLKTTEAA